MWDIVQPNPEKPLLQIDLNKADDWGGVGMEGERGSVYALGTGQFLQAVVLFVAQADATIDPAGKVLAAGTPERVVRLWDPRVGDQSIGKLIGHSDCVRSVIVSEDGRYVSSVTNVKELKADAVLRCSRAVRTRQSSQSKSGL